MSNRLVKEGYKERLIEKKLDIYLETFGAVCIQGPKFCGKTWTSSSRAVSSINIGDSTNNFQNRAMALLDPGLVLEGDRPRLIDEWQEVPSIWDATRNEVDKSIAKGQFILTSSATPNTKGVLHGGTGRIATLTMETMSLYESGDSDGKVSLMSLFNDELKAINTGEVKLRRLVDLCVRGGWPANLDNKHFELLAKAYLDTVINEDVEKLDIEIRNKAKFRSLIHSLARNESTLVNNSKLKRDMEEYDGLSIDPDTVNLYLEALRRIFLIHEQAAYAPELRSSKRFLKSSKRHFIDPSLAVAALGSSGDMLMNDLNTFGFIFESLCEHDIRIYADYLNAKVFHMRDDKGNEVDIVVELEDGSWGAFEVKLGASQIESACKELLKVREILRREGSKEPKFLCVICGLTNMAYKRAEDGIFVVPITSLRP